MTYPRLSWKLQGYPMSPKNMNRQVFFQLKALVARDLLRQSGKQDVTASNPMLSCKPLSVAMRWAAYNFRSSKFFFRSFSLFASVFAQIQIVQIHATEAQEAKKVRATAPQRLEEALRGRRTGTAPAAAAAAPPSAGWAAVRTPPKAVAVNTVRGVAKEDVFGRNDSFTRVMIIFWH